MKFEVEKSLYEAMKADGVAVEMEVKYYILTGRDKSRATPGTAAKKAPKRFKTNESTELLLAGTAAGKPKANTQLYDAWVRVVNYYSATNKETLKRSFLRTKLMKDLDIRESPKVSSIISNLIRGGYLVISK